MLKRSGMGAMNPLDISLKSSDIWLIRWVWKINPQKVPHIFEHPLRMKTGRVWVHPLAMVSGLVDKIEEQSSDMRPSIAVFVSDRVKAIDGEFILSGVLIVWISVLLVRCPSPRI